MNKEIQTLWTAALRSGDYRQGVGVLKTRDGDFCCLGVLCDLAVKAGVIESPEEIHADDDSYVTGYRYESETGVLPESVMEWAGIPYSEGTYSLSDEEMTERYGNGWQNTDYYRKTSLINANDSYGKSFDQIADLIEKHF